MKTIIIFLSLIFVFCDNDNNLYYLKKYSRVTITSKESGIIYLENFELNESIHLHFYAREGTINKSIFYDFSDSIPNPSFSPKYKLDPSFIETEESEESDRVTGIHCHFDFKKEINKKYIIIKYNEFYGEILYIDNLIVSSTLMIICILSFIGLCCCGKILLCVIQKRKNKMIENTINENLTNS